MSVRSPNAVAALVTFRSPPWPPGLPAATIYLIDGGIIESA
ncbi:hypothetical protein [Nocardia sp. NPDC057440]